MDVTQTPESPCKVTNAHAAAANHGDDLHASPDSSGSVLYLAQAHQCSRFKLAVAWRKCTPTLSMSELEK